MRRLRYVRNSKRTWRPRKTFITGEDDWYYGREEREKIPPDLSPNMLAVYHALSASEERTVRQLVEATGLSKSQVQFALEALAYRYIADKTTDGRRVWWTIR